MYQYPRPPDTGHPLRPKKITESYTDYTMKGENPDKFRVSAFSFSLLFRHFPAKRQKQLLSFLFLFCLFIQIPRDILNLVRYEYFIIAKPFSIIAIGKPITKQFMN